MNTKNVTTLLVLVLLLATALLACGHSSERQSSHSTVVFIDNKDRGWLGVSVDDVTPQFARRKNLKAEEGAFVTGVTSDSPAENAGIKEGDVIVEYDGKKIYDNNDLIGEVRRTKPGTEVNIAVVRDGNKKILKATVGKMPREPRVYSFNVPPVPRIHVEPHISIMRSSTLYGLTMEDLNRQLGEYFGAPNGRGVLVKSVKRNSEAEKAGFKAGDVIVKIGKETIADVDDIYHALDGYKDGEKAEFEVLRKGSTQKLTLTIDEASERDFSFHRFDMGHDWDDDVVIDLYTPEEGAKLRREADRFKREMEHFKEELHDKMIELKDKIRKRIGNVRMSVSV